MSFLVAIPIYNEEEYVANVIREVKKYADHILVVDDGSRDATPKLLAGIGGIDVIKHGTNQGYGSSLIDAFAHASRGNHEYIITMDCDEQHQPSQIRQFIEEAPKADIISGSRYMRPCPDCDAPPQDRRSINATITGLINELTGYRLTDAFCGFKTYRMGRLCELRLTEPGYGMPLQLWLQAAKHGLSVCEIPVRIIYGDPGRGFGHGLDDADARLQYYMEVIEREKQVPAPARCDCRGGRCR